MFSNFCGAVAIVRKAVSLTVTRGASSATRQGPLTEGESSVQLTSSFYNEG